MNTKQLPILTPARPPQEEELIDAAKTDGAAAGKLFDRYYLKISNFIYHSTFDRELTEDLTSTVFLTAFENLGRYQWRRVPFGAWLYRIASNELKMQFRRNRKVKLVSIDSYLDGKSGLRNHQIPNTSRTGQARGDSGSTRRIVSTQGDSEMNRSNDRIENYMEQVNLPSFKSEEHRQALRQRVVELPERRHKMGTRTRTRKLTLIAAVLILTAAAAAGAGIAISNYYFAGEGEDGHLLFISDPQEDGSTLRISVEDEDKEEIDVEQMKIDLQEIDRLREQNDREIIGVFDSWTNGNFDRTIQYEYTLSSGEKHKMNEGDEEVRPQIAEASDLEELKLLKEQGKGRLVRLVEIETEGKKAVGYGHIFVLGDGSKKLWMTGERSVWSDSDVLFGTGKAEYVGTHKRAEDGREITIDKYKVTDPNGKVHTISEGSVFTEKVLTRRNLEEWLELREKGAGEDLGEEIKEVNGKKFKFKKLRYMLSDGTEYIVAKGVPVE